MRERERREKREEEREKRHTHRERERESERERERDRERGRGSIELQLAAGGRAPARGERKRFERDPQDERRRGDLGFNYYTLGGLTSGLKGYPLNKSKKCYLGTFFVRNFIQR